MIKPDELKQVDAGSGYFIGEIKEQHKHLTYLKPKTLVTLFDGVDTMLNFVTEKMPKAKESKSSESTGRSKFNAFATYEEAMDTFRNRPEQITTFDPAEMRVKDLGEIGNEVEYDVTGDFIDIGRYMEGIPEVMGNMHNGNARNRRANIVINLNQYSGIDHEVIKHRGERVLRLIDALEAGGVRTMLTAIESTQCDHIEVVVKRHDEPLTIGDLAVVTHPEFLRRTIFRIVEHSKTWDWGYGSAMLFGRALTPEIIEGDNVTELDIVIDSNIEDNYSTDRVFDQIERLLVWEMSKPVTEVSSIKLDRNGVWFNPTGSRSEEDIKREGMEVLSGK